MTTAVVRMAAGPFVRPTVVRKPMEVLAGIPVSTGGCELRHLRTLEHVPSVLTKLILVIFQKPDLVRKDKRTCRTSRTARNQRTSKKRNIAHG